MEAQLQVPYRDTAAGDLVWRLGAGRQAALAALELHLAGARLELRLLGHSHQVIFTPCGAVISEVVACEWPEESALRRAGLPSRAESVVDDWAYRFRSQTHRLRPDRFGHWVDLLVGRLVDRPDAIVGRFPGSPHAVTALVAGPAGPGGAGVRWRTWHAYPQDGRLVSTATTVRRR